MIIKLINRTASPKVYLSGLITVPASSFYVVPTNLNYEAATDAQLRADISANLIQVSDSVSNFGTNDALAYLNRLVGTKDSDGVGITSTEISSKIGLDVNVINPIETSLVNNFPLKNIYAEVSSVANNVLTTIISYTVPATKSAYLKLASCSGENIAEYRVLLNGVVISKARTMWGASFNHDFSFADEGVSLTSNDVIEVKVIHLRPHVAGFNVNLQIKEEN